VDSDFLLPYRRFELIYKEGIITAKRISEMTGVIGSAISSMDETLYFKRRFYSLKKAKMQRQP
jgi:hypothetical protein